MCIFTTDIRGSEIWLVEVIISITLYLLIYMEVHGI